LDHLQTQKAQITDYLIISVALALVPVALLVIYFAARNGWSIAQPLQLLTFVTIWILALRRSLLTPPLRASVIIVFLLGRR